MGAVGSAMIPASSSAIVWGRAMRYPISGDAGSSAGGSSWRGPPGEAFVPPSARAPSAIDVTATAIETRSARCMLLPYSHLPLGDGGGVGGSTPGGGACGARGTSPAITVFETCTGTPSALPLNEIS